MNYAINRNFLESLPEKFHCIPLQYTISKEDYKKYVDYAYKYGPKDEKYTPLAFFSPYFTGKIVNNQNIICSFGISNDSNDVELTKFNEEYDDEEDYYIKFVSFEFGEIVTFIDAKTRQKYTYDDF